MNLQTPDSVTKVQQDRRARDYLLRRGSLFSLILSVFFAITQSNAIHFQTHQIWTSWGFVPFGFALLLFPVTFCTSTTWTLLRHRKILRNETEWRAECFANAPLVGRQDSYPPVTVQIPIYMEPFDGIQPTLDGAILAAKRYTEATGQRANVLICEDGLLVLTANDVEGFARTARAKPRDQRSTQEREVLQRLDYYASHDVVWVARPKPTPGRPETQRAGKFKKASNLNYSFRLEEVLLKGDKATPEELAPFEPGRWHGDIRIHDIILQLDKDSITHPDVIVATIPEFLEDTQLAYTQHNAYPSNEADTFFSLMVGYFTRSLYDIAIKARALFPGTHIPVMGHNVFIRKSALVEVGGWSEDSVCEDLHFMMDVHIAGYHGKYIAYPGLEFGEAVTRTYSEELEKFRRYSYGASETVFNPIADWERRGVFRESFRRYVSSPHVGWYHVYDLLSFFCSLFNLATIMPFAVGVAAGWISFNQAAIQGYCSVSIFCIFASFAVWTIRRKGGLDRLTKGESWRGARGAFRAFAGQLLLGLCFIGYSLSVMRGGLDYLRGKWVAFAATDVDDLDAVSLMTLLKRMAPSLKESLFLIFLGSVLTYVEVTRIGDLQVRSLMWAAAILVHISIPFLFNEFVLKKTLHAAVGLVGFEPARALSARAPVPQKVLAGVGGEPERSRNAA